MAEITPPAWVEQSGNHARQGRLLSTAGTTAGVWTNADLAVSNPSGLNISVAAGGCFVMATSTAQGGFACYNDAAKAPSGSLPSAPASTQVSLIVAKVHAKEFGDGTDDWQLLIVNGTPGGGTPATPSNALLLATATVNAGSTSVNSLVDNRVVYGEGGVVRATGMANQVPDIVKAAASQSADLSQWQDNTGASQASINPFGSMQLGGSGGYIGRLTVYTAASAVAAVLRGAASQTADLQQWQDNTGAVLAKVMNNGDTQVPFFSVGGTRLGGVVSSFISNGTGSVVIAAQGFAGQTASLQEWRDSTGTVKGSLTPQGTVTLAQGILAGSFNFSGVTYSGVSAPSGAGSLPNFVVGQGGSGDLTQWRNGGSTVVAYVNAAGNVAGTGAYTTLSDASVKENVRDLRLDAVDVVRRLRPVHYDYIDGEADQVGFIAQDVQEVLPHAVVPFSGSADEGDDRLGLRSDAILAYVVAAVQTLLTDKAA